MTVNVGELMDLSVAALRAGNPERAVALADLILQQRPDHRGARHMKLCIEHRTLFMPFTCMLLHDEEKYDIGDFTYGFPQIKAGYFQDKLTIGKFTAIAEDVTIFLSANHRIDWITGYGFSAPNYGTLFPKAPARSGPEFTSSNGPVTIGSDVWIGTGATIMSGVTIGDGAVIAARSVVNRDVAPYEIVGGNPVKRARWRFEPEIIELLLRVRWWDWPDDKIRAHVGELLGDDVRGFIAAHDVGLDEASSG